MDGDASTTGRMLFLIGQAASGKSTLGRALARRTSRPFVDLDTEIEHMVGMSVPEIFATQGEEAFRAHESRALDCVLRRADRPIVACGGGTPCRPGAIDAMLETGTVVLLRADMDTTVRRILEAPGTRPRLAAVADLRRALSDEWVERAPAYTRATYTFDSSRLETSEEILRSVDLFINTIPF